MEPAQPEPKRGPVRDSRASRRDATNPSAESGAAQALNGQEKQRGRKISHGERVSGILGPITHPPRLSNNGALTLSFRTPFEPRSTVGQPLGPTGGKKSQREKTPPVPQGPPCQDCPTGPTCGRPRLGGAEGGVQPLEQEERVEHERAQRGGHRGVVAPDPQQADRRLDVVLRREDRLQRLWGPDRGG